MMQNEEEETGKNSNAEKATPKKPWFRTTGKLKEEEKYLL